MRIAVTINGKVSVHEVLEFEPQEDGSVLLTTHEETVDLVIRGMQPLDISGAINELMAKGYADLRKFDAAYDDCIADEDDDEPDVYSAVCPACQEQFNFEMTPQAAVLGVIVCPHCGEELEFDACEGDNMLRLVGVTDDEDEDDEDALMYETTCPQCHTTIDVNQHDVDAGSMICPICNANLEFDAIDADTAHLAMMTMRRMTDENWNH